MAAAALLEMCDAPNQVLHLAHPKPVPWSSIVTPVSEALRLPLVSYSQWLSKLEDGGSGELTAGKSERNPALHLQEFFRSFASSSADDLENGVDGSSASGEAMGSKQLCLREAVKLSPSLRNCEPLSFDEAKKWLVSWRLMEWGKDGNERE